MTLRRLLALAFAYAAATTPAIAAPERLVFVGSDDFAPYQYLDARGEPRGFNVELVRALARETGIEIEIRLVKTESVLPIVESGEADLVCFGYSAARARRFTMLLPLWRLRQVGLVRADRTTVPESVRDLQSEALIEPTSSIIREEIDALPPAARPRLVPSADLEDAARRVADGRATLFLGNHSTLRDAGVLGRVRGVREIEWRAIPYYLAASPGRDDLVPIFFAAYMRLQESGEFSAIIERTMLSAPEQAGSEWARYLLGALGVAALALAGVAAWNRALRSQVDFRTREVGAVIERLEFHGLVQRQVSDAIIVLNGDGRITMWNNGAEAIFAIAAADALGAPVDRVLSTLTMDTGIADVRETVERNGMWIGEAKIRRPSGAEVHVEATVQALRNPDGGSEGRLVVVHDIDARKRAENELRAALSLHRATLESTGDGIIAINRDGMITSYNQRFLQMWELSEELVRTPDLMRGVVAAKVDNLDELVRRYDDINGTDVSDLVTLHLKDGRIFERHSHPQRIGGQIVGRVFSYRDATDRIRADEERRRLEAQIQQVQKLESLGVLAGGIAHDFNNLLVGMMGHAGLALMDLPTDSPIRQRIEQIETCAQRAAELTNQMLAYSGKGRFVVQPIDVSSVVREMTNLLQTAISKSAKLELRLAANLPAVSADGAQLRQVVMNLITNASDAIGEGSGTIALTTGVMEVCHADLDGAHAGSSAEPGEHVFIEVRDDGCGMDAATRDRIFEPFFTTKFTGRGLGLAAVLGIVRGHRGAVRIDSIPGRGTTFRILLPSCASPAAVQETENLPPTPRRQARVLVVDDEPSVRTIAREALTRAGFTVVTASDGEEALERLRAEGAAVDAVLLDMTMPGLTGVETLRAIHQIVSDLPVVLTSGYSEQEAADRCGRETMFAFIQKPFAPSSLVAKMSDAVDARARV